MYDNFALYGLFQFNKVLNNIGYTLGSFLFVIVNMCCKNAFFGGTCRCLLLTFIHTILVVTTDYINVPAQQLLVLFDYFNFKQALYPVVDEHIQAIH